MKRLAYTALSTALSALLFCTAAQAGESASTTHSANGAGTQTTQFQDLRITVQGEGRPVLMIPGLNSAASVWTETCQQLQPGVKCLMVQLPGFAGASAAEAMSRDFLGSSTKQILAYLKQAAPQGAVVVGHSLGGVLGLMLAAEAETPVTSLVVVDSLPYLPGIQNPNATPESVRPMAEGMRAGMAQPASDAQKRSMLTPMAATMTLDPQRAETIVQWGLSSHGPSSGQAMYELWTTDLRTVLPRIKVPTTVLGSWAAYARMGSTLESTRGIFERQYASLPGVQLSMSERGYHFLMWDDLPLVLSAVKTAVNSPITR